MYNLMQRYALIPALLILFFFHAPTRAADFSLRFYGTGTGDIDRVKIPSYGAANPLNIGNGHFTIEFWLKAFLSNNTGTVAGGGDSWTTGNIIIDRDIFGNGDFGDFGISLGNGRVAFGIHNGSSGTTILASNNVADGIWHHIAVTRSFSGAMAVFVDGTQDVYLASGPAGNISYNTGRTTSWPNDPYLVIAAEKHDYDPSTYPSFNGWLDELHISTNIRYSTNFSRPDQYTIPDQFSVGLFRFNEGSGTVVSNYASSSPTHGVRMVALNPERPAYVTDVPPLVPEPAAALLPLTCLIASSRFPRNASSLLRL